MKAEEKQKKADKAATQKIRKANRNKKKKLPTEDIAKEIKGELLCPFCGGDLSPENLSKNMRDVVEQDRQERRESNGKKAIQT